MARITVVLNRKGGIGKSTITVNTAAITADVHGKSPDGEPDYVAVISIDPQGSATWWAERVGEELPFAFMQIDAPEELEGLADLRKSKKIKHIFIDTPGWASLTEEQKRQAVDPLGKGPAADALRTVLKYADDVLIPIEPEAMGFVPTADTISEIVKPRKLPYLVVVSNWDPRDGRVDLEETQEYIRLQGWNQANAVIRHYKLHARAAADGQVVTQYPKNRVAMEAREDFYRLALELGVGGGKAAQ